jgi:predicted dehydrogenase
MAKVRMGMVGGGEGAFIGGVHRMAAALDGEIELVCGAFSSDEDRAIRSGLALHLPAKRVYRNFQEMMQLESALPLDQRMQFVAIVTPNFMHYPVAKAALQAGFHVMSDKPATFDLAQAIKLRALIEQTGLLYGLTYTYAGYPLIKEARSLISKGELGKIRKVIVEYSQGWLAGREEDNSDNKQAAWRLDASKAGISSCMGDIGVHAAHLVEYVSGLEITELCADLTAFVDGRKLDDDGSMLLRLDGGAKGLLTASQVCVGEENNLSLRVFGELATIEWHQQEPNTLLLKQAHQPTQVLRTGAENLSDIAKLNTRIPMGHPEGYLEAFANIYLAFASKIRADEKTVSAEQLVYDCPGINEAVRGMAFIELAVQASKSDVKWHLLKKY